MLDNILKLGILFWKAFHDDGNQQYLRMEILTPYDDIETIKNALYKVHIEALQNLTDEMTDDEDSSEIMDEDSDDSELIGLYMEILRNSPDTERQNLNNNIWEIISSQFENGRQFYDFTDSTD